MAGPKRWVAFDGRTTEVDTPYTIRAKQLKDLYLTLSVGEGQLGQEERLDALLSLKTTVGEHDCRLTREITELVDREAELMQRGMKEASLKGQTLPPFLPPPHPPCCHMCFSLLPLCRVAQAYQHTLPAIHQDPALQPSCRKPHQSMYANTRTYKHLYHVTRRPPHPQVPTDPSLLRAQVYYCCSCSSYLPSTEFELSSNSRSVGHCRSCRALDNKARDREDHSTYRAMLHEIRTSEERFADGSKVAFLMQVGALWCVAACEADPACLLQEADMKHLVEGVWAGQSVLSAERDLFELTVVRWDRSVEWSPWNCVVLTHSEADYHRQLDNVEEVRQD